MTTTDARLAEIDAEVTEQGPFYTCCEFACRHHDMMADAINEVRRLKRALQLSESSRGIPVTVGRD